METFTPQVSHLQEQFEAELRKAYERGYADALAQHQVSFDAALDTVMAEASVVTLYGQDEVTVAGVGVFHRASHEVRPNWPYAMRFEANRDLTDDEVEHLSHLVAYTFAATVRGEGVGPAVRDTPRSFHLGADSTKSRRSDVAAAFDEFEVNLDSYLLNGSPVRTTNRAGAGTAGTRAVEGMGDPGLRVTVYYDEVRR